MTIRVKTLLPVVCILLAQPANAAETKESTSTDIVLHDRAPLAFLLLLPSGNIANTDTTSVIQTVSKLLEQHTDFALEEIASESVAECEGLFWCMVQNVRKDYRWLNYDLGNGGRAPFEEHLKYVATKKIPYPEFLLVLSNLELETGDRLTITMIDTTRALAYIHKSTRSGEDWKEHVETQVNEAAVAGEPQSSEVKDESQLRSFLEQVFTTKLRRRFTDANHWEPFGRIEITSSSGGHGIQLGGTTVGTTRAGLTRVLNVRAGEHKLAFSHPEYRPYETTITVQAGEMVRVAPTLEVNVDESNAALRTGLTWTGLAFAGIGAAFVGYAIAVNDGEVATFCAEGTGNCQTGKRFVGFGFDKNAAPTFNDTVNGGSLLIAPLGYSLAAAGGTWALGTLFIGDEGDFPWMQLVAGVCVGVLSYSLSAVLNPSNPFDRPQAQ